MMRLARQWARVMVVAGAGVGCGECVGGWATVYYGHQWLCDGGRADGLVYECSDVLYGPGRSERHGDACAGGCDGGCGGGGVEYSDGECHAGARVESWQEHVVGSGTWMDGSGVGVSGGCAGDELCVGADRGDL